MSETTTVHDVSIVPRSGLGCELPGGRAVACFRLSDGGYLWQWTRPGGDATVTTALHVSDDACKAMISIGLKMLEATTTSDVALAT